MQTIKGLFFRDFTGDYVPEILKEIFFEKLYDSLIKPGNIVVDCGANQGYFTYWASIKGAAKVYAVEPAAMHCEVLRKMIEFNGMEHVEIIPLAVSNTDGEATFYHNDNTTMFSLTPGKGEKETVKTVTIGNLVKDIPHIDILKVDVEGAEGILFSHASFDEVAKKTDNIIVEYHNWCGITAALLMNTIRDRGYKVKLLPTQATVLLFQKV